MTKPIVGGKPLKFPTPEDLAKAINEYLEKTPTEEMTVTGLCLSMGTSRVVLDDYMQRDGYKDIVKQAKLIVENSYELSLRKHGRSGDIFALKNFGWKDKSELDVKDVSIVDALAEAQRLAELEAESISKEDTSVEEER